jgi:hypothetical protein
LGQGQPVTLKEALISVGIQFYKKSLNVSPAQRSDYEYDNFVAPGRGA